MTPAGVPREAKIVAARVTAGHDGSAELVLNVLHENGVAGSVVLDGTSAFDVMAYCAVERLDDLVGRSWRSILDGCQNGASEPWGPQISSEQGEQS